MGLGRHLNDTYFDPILDFYQCSLLCCLRKNLIPLFLRKEMKSINC